jgi:hypothetical protein
VRDITAVVLGLIPTILIVVTLAWMIARHSGASPPDVLDAN